MNGQWCVSSGSGMPFDVRCCRTSANTRSIIVGTGPAWSSTKSSRPNSRVAIRRPTISSTPTSSLPASPMYRSPCAPRPPATNSSSRSMIHYLPSWLIRWLIGFWLDGFRVLCVDAIVDAGDKNSDWRLDLAEYKALMDSTFQPKEKCA